MFLNNSSLDRKIEVLRDGRWVELAPEDLAEGQIIRMWGLFIDANGNSAFKVTSSVYNVDGHKNIDVKPINFAEEK
jgi:hypothetical protein